MGDSGGNRPDGEPKPRKVRTRQPTLIGIVAENPAAIQPPTDADEAGSKPSAKEKPRPKKAKKSPAPRKRALRGKLKKAFPPRPGSKVRTFSKPESGPKLAAGPQPAPPFGVARGAPATGAAPETGTSVPAPPPEAPPPPEATGPEAATDEPATRAAADPSPPEGPTSETAAAEPGSAAAEPSGPSPSSPHVEGGSAALDELGSPLSSAGAEQDGAPAPSVQSATSAASGQHEADPLRPGVEGLTADPPADDSPPEAGSRSKRVSDRWSPGAAPSAAAAPEFGELESELTKVSDEPEEIHTDVGIQVPFEADMASEASPPSAPEVMDEGISSTDVASPEPTEGPIAVVSSAGVSSVSLPHAPAEGPSVADPMEATEPQVPMIDTESGSSAPPEEGGPATVQTVALGEGVSVGLIVAAATFCGLLIIAIGAGIGYLLISPSDPEPTPTEVRSPGDPAEGGEPPSAGVESGEQPSTIDPEPGSDQGSVDEPTASLDDEPDDDEPDDDEPDDDELDEGDDPEVTPAPGGASVSIAEIESYELSRPRTPRRARRMPAAARRRQAARFRVRALAAYRAERWDEAASAYSDALGFNDWDVAAIEGMARTRARQGQFPEAVAWAELAVQRNPRSPATYRVLGDVWRQAGHEDRALAAWRRGLSRHRNDRWLRQRIREAEAE